MTTYVLEPGYSASHKYEDVDRHLLHVVKHFCERPELILYEVLKLHPLLITSRDEILECCQHYNSADPNDSTIKVRQDSNSPPVRVVQNCSGSNQIKPLVRRAFCRLVIAAMHEKNMEVNLFVC